MSFEVIKILIASIDQNLNQEISEKIRAHCPQLKFKFSIFTEGTSALQDFKINRHDIVLCSELLPGISGIELVEQISILDGTVNQLLLGTLKQTALVESVSLPIVNWNQFLTKVQQALPEEIKVRYGLNIRNNSLYTNILEYGKKYSPVPNSSQIATLPFIQIPDFFNTQSYLASDSNSKINSLKSDLSVKTPSSDINLKGSTLTFKTNSITNSSIQKPSSKAEFIIFVGILLLTLFYFYWKTDEELNLVSVKSFLLTVCLISIFGFTSHLWVKHYLNSNK